MKAISRWLDRFCYKHPRFGIPNLMKFIVIGNVLIYLLDMFSRGYATLLCMFYPSAVLHGEVWRIITFLFVPVSGYSSSDMFSIYPCRTNHVLFLALKSIYKQILSASLRNGSHARGGRPPHTQIHTHKPQPRGTR